MLQLKNIKTGDTWEIPSEGFFLGRAGAKAEIQIADPGVSKKHARIFEQNGAWFLEDVGSSNGTYIQGKRLSEPVQLNEGLVFGMSRNKFQVVTIAGNGAVGNGASAGVAEDDLFDQDLPPPDDLGPPGGPPLPPAAPPGPDPYAAPASAPQYAPPNGAYTPPGQPAPGSMSQPPHGAPPQSLPPQGMPPPQAPGAPMGAQQPMGTQPPMGAPGYPPQQAQGAQPGYGTQPPQAAAPDGEAPADISFGYIMVAVPKAIAFYMARVPLLILNPFGTVRKSYEDQPVHAMGKAELFVYAFVGFAATTVINLISSVIGGVIAGAIGAAIVGAITGLIIGAVSAIVGGLIMGLFGHAILGWFVRILKGESDDRSRTNYFLMFFTASIVAAMPSGLGAIFSSFGNVPFVICVGPLLTMVGTALTLFVFYKWFKFFQVHKVIPILILVALGFSVLGTGFGFVMSVVSSVSMVLDGSGDVDIPDNIPAEARAQIEAAQKNLAAMEAAGATPEQVEAAKKAMAMQMDAIKKANPPPKDDPKDPDAPKDPKDPDTKTALTPKPPPDVDAPPPPTVGEPDITFGQFNKKLRQVERKLAGEPALLVKDKDVRRLYSQLSAIEYAADQKLKERIDDEPKLRKVFERDRDAEVWAQASGIVQELGQKLGFK